MNTEVRTPVFRSPFTDFGTIFGGYCVQRAFKMLCRRIELDYLDCLEAYGVEKGYQKCHEYREDLHECLYGKKQKLRVEEMRKEREKQYNEGKLKQKYEDRPPNDSIYDLNI